jgi:putative DNA primase/helicase
MRPYILKVGGTVNDKGFTLLPCPGGQEPTNENTAFPATLGYPAVFKEAQSLGWVNPQSSVARDFGVMGGTTTAMAGQESGQPFFVSLGELLANKQPPDWLIHRHIEANSLALLFGPPSAGKSFLAIDWALCVATGREWNGHKTKQGSVCYLAGEGFAGFRRRCAVWGIQNGVEVDDAPLYFNNKTIQLIDENSCREAHEAANNIVKEKGSLSLLVLDTFNRTGGGDENSNTETAQIITNLEKYFLRPFKCSVLIIHHSGHGEDSKNRTRGASALPAGVDSSFMLVAKDGFRNLIPQKQKESELGETTTYTLKTITLDDWPLDPDTLEVQNSAVIVPCDAPINSGKVKKLTPRLRDAFDCLIVAKDTGKSIEPPPQVVEQHEPCEPDWCVAESEWRELFYTCPSLESDTSQEAKRKAFRRAVDDLLKLDRVRGSHGYFWPIG